VLVIAHRGCPNIRRPENTVASVVAAADGPADGVEVDARLSGDGVLVCSHDADLARLSGRALPIASSTAVEIRRVALAGGHRTATLDEVLAASIGRLVIEVKPVANAAAALRTATALQACLDGAVPRPGITVSSVDPMLLATIRGALERSGRTYVRTGLLGRPAAGADALLRRTLDDGHDEMHPHVGSLLAAPHLVAVGHSLGAAVTCWTVNRRRDLRRLAQLGVDAVITDRPVAAHTTLAARRLLAPGTIAIRARTCSPGP
jgi:glycerophosphoryl diester phosphodiesterase